MSNRLKGHSSSPFYDLDFATQPNPYPPRRKKPMPISTRTIERWICDRCGFKGEFPNELGHMASEEGWLRFDLGASLVGNKLKQKNEHILCPTCLDKLKLWFELSSTSASAMYNEGEEARYDAVVRGRMAVDDFTTQHPRN